MSKTAETAPRAARDEELWQKAEAAYPFPEKPTPDAMRKAQEPYTSQKKELFERIKALIAEMRETRSKLFLIVVPPDYRLAQTEKRQQGRRGGEGERRGPYRPEEDELLQQTIRFYHEFKDDSGGREAKLAALAARADEIGAVTRKLSAGLVAHSLAENEERTAELEQLLETGSLSAEEEKEIVTKIKALRRELASRGASRKSRRMSEHKALEAIGAACKANVASIPGIVQTYDVCVYTVIDELRRQERAVRDQVRAYVGPDAAKGGAADGRMTRGERADALMAEIEKKLEEIQAEEAKVAELDKKSDAIYEEYKKSLDAWREAREAVFGKRREKYRELLNEKHAKEHEEYVRQREAEKQAKINKWLEFIDFREKDIQGLIDALHRLEAGEPAPEKPRAAPAGAFARRDRDEPRGPLSGFTRMVRSIQELAAQLRSMHLNHEFKLKGQGCKEADEAFAKLIKQDSGEKQEDVAMIPTKREQLKMERQAASTGRRGPARAKKAKTLNMDDFLEGHAEAAAPAEQAPAAPEAEHEPAAEGAAEPAAPAADKPKLSEGQLFSLERYSIAAPQTFDDVLGVVEKLEALVGQRIQRELAARQADFDRIRALRDEFLNPPAEQAEQGDAAAEKKEGEGAAPEAAPGEAEAKSDAPAAERQRRPARARGQFWFYIPDGLIREAFYFKEEGWPEKLSIAARARGPGSDAAPADEKPMPSRRRSARS